MNLKRLRTGLDCATLAVGGAVTGRLDMEFAPPLGATVSVTPVCSDAKRSYYKIFRRKVNFEQFTDTHALSVN